MKFPILILVAIIINVQNVMAQNQRKLYYSKQWEITTKDSASYYRICELDTIKYKFEGDIVDYSINDQLVMKGAYRAGQKNGIFYLYHPNGQLESQGEFKDDMRMGTWKYYFSTGKIYREVTFTADDFFVNTLYDTTGALLVNNGTGNWSYEYEWPNLTFRIVVKGRFEDGKKVGEWNCFTSTGDPIYDETFSKGKFKKGIRIDSKNKTPYMKELQNKFLPPYKFEVTEKFMYLNFVKRSDYPFLGFLPLPYGRAVYNVADTTGLIYVVVEESASPKGGLGAFYQFVTSNLRYPVEARKKGIVGRVFVEFIVNTDGRISEAKVIKGIGGGCDEEAIRIVSSSPDWNPARQRGKAVKQRYVMPIIFKIGSK